MLQAHHFLSSSFPFSLSRHPQKPNFLFKPAISLPVLPKPGPRIEPCLAQVQEPTTITTSPPPEEGPIELTQSIFATSDNPSPLQVATSVLLTGAISVFLFRSLRRRAKRAKELVSFINFVKFSLFRLGFFSVSSCCHNFYAM